MERVCLHRWLRSSGSVFTASAALCELLPALAAPPSSPGCCIPHTRTPTHMHTHPASPPLLQVGQRGYYALRQLSLAGHDAVNISGGFKSFREQFGEHPNGNGKL